MKVLIIIINSARLVESVYPLAALIQKLPQHSKIYIIPANRAWFLKNIFEIDLEIIKTEIHESEPIKPNIYLIDIGPKDFDINDLIRFSKQYFPQIGGWISYIWPQNNASEINFFRKITTLKEDEFLSQGIEKIGFNVESDLKNAERLLISHNIKLILEDPDVSRIFKAFKVAKEISRHTREDHLFPLVMPAVVEISSGRHHKLISSQGAKWDDMQNLTKIALKNMHDELEIFAEAKKINRPVGYVNLGKVPEYIDIKTIMTQAVTRFPYLVVIRYQVNDEWHTNFISTKLQDNKLLQKYQQENLDTKEYAELLNILILYHTDVPINTN